MLEDFHARFGQLELGPPDRPDHGRFLYDRGSRAKRYALDDTTDVDSWAIDVRTGERAFRIDVARGVFLPNGRAVAPPAILPSGSKPAKAPLSAQRPAGDLARRIYGQR